MKGVYIVGEDPVTLEIIQRILSVYAPDLQIIQTLPARGSEIKNKIGNFNQLSQSNPVILLTDLDTDNCAPILKDKLLKGMEKNTERICWLPIPQKKKYVNRLLLWGKAAKGKNTTVHCCHLSGINGIYPLHWRIRTA